jgi:hypothetical protein
MNTYLNHFTLSFISGLAYTASFAITVRTLNFMGLFRNAQTATYSYEDISENNSEDGNTTM